MSFIEKLKRRWGVGPWGVLAILLSFTLAGSTVVRLKGPIVHLLTPPDAPGWQRWGIYLLVVIPLYHALLFGYGALLGQYPFFRRKFAAIGRGIVLLASRFRVKR